MGNSFLPMLKRYSSEQHCVVCQRMCCPLRGKGNQCLEWLLAPPPPIFAEVNVFGVSTPTKPFLREPWRGEGTSYPQKQNLVSKKANLENKKGGFRNLQLLQGASLGHLDAF